MIDITDAVEVKREAERRTRLRNQGARTFEDRPCHARPRDQWCDRDGVGGFMGHTCSGEVVDDSNAGRIIDPIEYSLDEKAIEHACDQLAQKAGARVIRFSHPGKTQQTPGIADRLYCFPRAEVALWFEVKTPRGAQRPGQVLFEEIVTASGHYYACGGIGDLRAWLIANLAFRAEEL